MNISANGVIHLKKREYRFLSGQRWLIRPLSVSVALRQKGRHDSELSPSFWITELLMRERRAIAPKACRALHIVIAAAHKAAYDVLSAIYLPLFTEHTHA
jgi:hypothetical protein